MRTGSDPLRRFDHELANPVDRIGMATSEAPRTISPFIGSPVSTESDGDINYSSLMLNDEVFFSFNSVSAF